MLMWMYERLGQPLPYTIQFSHIAAVERFGDWDGVEAWVEEMRVWLTDRFPPGEWELNSRSTVFLSTEQQFIEFRLRWM